MNTLYFDCSSGICGDMVLAAFIDLGIPCDKINSELSKLGLLEEPSVRSKKKSKILTGTVAEVIFDKTAKATGRSYMDIKNMLTRSGLDDFVKQKSLSMFKAIGQAEAEVHGVPLEKIHFHEIGAVDSIADIVGSAFCFSVYRDHDIYFSKLPVGNGTVETQHGPLPLPAPAAAILLEGVPVYGIDCSEELITPTGAAIVKEFAGGYTSFPPLTLNRSGTGFAKNALANLPGVLRIFEGSNEDDFDNDTVLLIEANIDDFNPEFYGFVQSRLLDAGALDVTITPVIMKKGRPGNTLSVLCKREDFEKISGLVLSQTSTIGIRYNECGRKKLKREDIRIDTPFGAIRAKKVFLGRSYRIHPEFEELKRISLEKGLPILEVHNKIMKALK